MNLFYYSLQQYYWIIPKLLSQRGLQSEKKSKMGERQQESPFFLCKWEIETQIKWFISKTDDRTGQGFLHWFTTAFSYPIFQCFQRLEIHKMGLLLPQIWEWERSRVVAETMFNKYNLFEGQYINKIALHWIDFHSGNMNTFSIKFISLEDNNIVNTGWGSQMLPCSLWCIHESCSI